MEESLPREPVLVPDLLSSTVLETRVGGAAAARLLVTPSRGGDLNTSHFCPRSTGISSGVPPLVPALGKTPLNLERGVFSNAGTRGGTPELMPVERGQKWDVLKSPPREGVTSSLAAAAPPTRGSRTVRS